MEKTVISNHNHGFFSNCSVRLHCIISYYNTNNFELPQTVDSSKSFIKYREPGKETDVTFEYFEHYDNVDVNICNKSEIDYIENYQYDNYKTLDYHAILPFVKKYFSPSIKIKQIINEIETKYSIDCYDNICCLFIEVTIK